MAQMSSQSAPTFLVYQVDLIFFLGSGTLKKIKSKKIDLKKEGCKKQGHCYSKREEAACFLQPTFFRSIFWT
jgi:hypothetical protein